MFVCIIVEEYKMYANFGTNTFHRSQNSYNSVILINY